MAKEFKRKPNQEFGFANAYFRAQDEEYSDKEQVLSAATYLIVSMAMTIGGYRLVKMGQKKAQTWIDTKI